jgi:hypothetical protein
MAAPMRQFIQQLISSLSLLNLFRRYKNRVSSMKIKAAQAYVLGVKKIRIFFLGALFVSVSFVLLINGLSLVQAAFFTYSSWSNEMKFIVALLLGGIEFLGAIGILIYLFREETWGKFSEIQTVVNSIIEDKSDKSR